MINIRPCCSVAVEPLPLHSPEWEKTLECFTPDGQSGLFPSLIFSFNGATLHRGVLAACRVFLIWHASVGADRHSCVSTCLLAGRGVPTYGGYTEWLDPWLSTVWICSYVRKMDPNSSGVMEYWWQFNGLFPSWKTYHLAIYFWASCCWWAAMAHIFFSNLKELCNMMTVCQFNLLINLTSVRWDYFWLNKASYLTHEKTSV